jgi:ferredoxin
VTEQTPATPHPGGELLRVAEAVHAGEVSVTFRPGPTVLAKVGEKLLDIAEASQVPIDSGCRMGMCGSDPVHILEGEENVSKMRLPPACRICARCIVRSCTRPDPDLVRPDDFPSTFIERPSQGGEMTFQRWQTAALVKVVLLPRRDPSAARLPHAGAALVVASVAVAFAFHESGGSPFAPTPVPASLPGELAGTGGL